MPEKLYLSCDFCGEVFDEFAAAQTHESDCSMSPSTYQLVTESEAF
jgi:hypothetical protein